MSTILGSISSNFFKKSIPLYASISNNTLQFHAFPKQNFPLPLLRVAHDPTYIPGTSPPEIPTAPPTHDPGFPSEVPRRHDVPDFVPNSPQEEPVPSGPGSPKPEVPPPPGEPEVVPPHGPEITPPEPGPPQPTRPDIPPPIMGSNGLAFY